MVDERKALRMRLVLLVSAPTRMWFILQENRLPVVPRKKGLTEWMYRSKKSNDRFEQVFEFEIACTHWGGFVGACPGWDEGTKRRLIHAAGEVFSQVGFRAGTIREICRRANASVSAVNYHFRDKAGLYGAVFEYAHCWALEKYPHDMGLSETATAEDRLRAFIRSFLLRILGDGFPAWHGRLIAQETANPSGVLSKLAETAIRPMDEYLDGIIRELIRRENPLREPQGPLVRLCRMNIIGQCIFHFHARQFMRFPGSEHFEPSQIADLAEQIARFSLGGVRAIAANNP